MKPIGIFDSGIGGLTVTKEIIQQLPYEDIVYFGDTAHLPYGVKSKETVIRLSIENILFLLKQRVKLICVACNTSSSVALPVIRNNFNVPIVDVIEPAVREAVYATKNKRIGIIGTKATIRSHTYKVMIKKLNPKIKVLEIACPLFVPLVEEGWIEGRIVKEIAKIYLKPLKNVGIDTLILGCTHYPLLKPTIRQVMGSKVILIDSAKQVAIEVKRILETLGMVNRRARLGVHKFYVSDDPEGFGRLAPRFLGSYVDNVRRVNHV
ncbi:MAG: glutamate racemase [Candidatus Omnitrophica bacterium]|nr:glutamate racemase [Candidatus Omnitrophota bacterium]